MSDRDDQISPMEATYYARHMRLPGFTASTQEKLRKSRVLIIGVGGLGCPAAIYLAGAGVGTIALCDADVVSVTNLHRQILFDSNDIGKQKVDAGAARLQAINPYIKLEKIDSFAQASSLDELVANYDVVVDGTDNFSAKYAINDACAKSRVPLVYGSIFQFEGQVSVFHLKTQSDEHGLSYRDLYPDAPPSGLSQNCGEAGVIGVLPGIVGTLQANEVIKIISGIGESLAGYLLIFDALTTSFKKLKLARNESSNERGGADQEEIAYEELVAKINSATPPFLIDVREFHERQEASIGGEHIPLLLLPGKLDCIPPDREIVVYCNSGMRSAKAALYLKSVLVHSTILSLAAGINGRICSLALPA
ncbi:molybdopterin/thiamine biosynthesis adenylyltransferase/rhodanese-related sulfurtransferase [Oxalobacteraceae bacterium GrIS 2.11]